MDGIKYKRFGNVVELQKEVRAALVKLLHERYGITPTSDENLIAEQTIEATSPFESKPIERIPWKDLDLDTARRLIATAKGCDPRTLSDADIIAEAMQRGLAWRDHATGIHYATAAGIVLLAKDPSAVFPQCRILAMPIAEASPTETHAIMRTSGGHAAGQRPSHCLYRPEHPSSHAHCRAQPPTARRVP